MSDKTPARELDNEQVRRVMYKVHIGYTQTGRNKYRKFSSLKEAAEYCNAVFLRSGIVLSIVEA